MATVTKNWKASTRILTSGLTEVGGPLWMTKGQLVRLNREAIQRGYNRTLKPRAINRLPDQRYPVSVAYRHVGFNGRNYDNVNYRLEVLLCEKRAEDPSFTPDDLSLVFLDITPESWKKLRRQKRAA